ncbi:MAG: hypothetical protein IJM18_09400 [Clostridia bacterium]|nr:hypothetical protein [Clostridia bacterium]
MELKLTPWRDLANAIVEQAAKDYIAALRKLRKYPENYRAKTQIAELERFFRSDWYGELTDIDVERLMRMLKKEVYGI